MRCAPIRPILVRTPFHSFVALDFQVRHEHFDIVVSNPERFDNQILMSWTLGAKLNQAPQSLARASAVFLGKDADDIKTMISDELVQLVDNSLLTSAPACHVSIWSARRNKLASVKRQQPNNLCPCDQRPGRAIAHLAR